MIRQSYDGGSPNGDDVREGDGVANLGKHRTFVFNPKIFIIPMETIQKSETIAKLAAAVVAVMKSVKGIDKTATIGTGTSQYTGVSDQIVKQVIGEKMAENGLSILPIGISPKTTISTWEEHYNGGGSKQKQSVFTEVLTEYLLMHDSGEFVVIQGYGHGVDTQDKGAGKSTTYALKYALLYSFLVPTGKLDDTDKTHSNDIPVPNPQPQQQPQPQPKSQPPQQSPTAVYSEREQQFHLKYATPEVIGEILERSECVNDLSHLYFINTEIIEANKPLKARFSALKKKFISENRHQYNPNHK